MMTWMAATNSAPSSRYSTAREPITTISDSALLMGCRCASRLTAPATQIRPKMEKSSQWSIKASFSFEFPLQFSRSVAGRLCRPGIGRPADGPTRTTVNDERRTKNLRGEQPTTHDQRLTTTSTLQSYYQTGNDQISDCQGQQHLPAETHELVVAEARQRAANPDIQKQKAEYAQQKPERRQSSLQPGGAEHRPLPAAEEQHRGEESDGEHVGVLGHEEHGEFHGAVLGVVSGHQFGFRLRQVKRHAVGFRERSHQVNKEGHDLAAKEVPLRQPSEPVGVLRLDNAAQAEGAGQNQHADERQPERDLIADHLRAGAQRAEQRIFAVRGPAGEGNAIYTDGGDAEDDQQRNVGIRNLQRRAHTGDIDRGPERNKSNGEQRRADGNDRGRKVEQLVHVGRREVFFQNELQPIRQGLQQAEGPDARWSPAVLD